MDQAVLADIEVTGTGAESPVVRNATSQIVLEPIEPAVAVLSVIPDLAEDAFLPAIQRLYGAAAVMNDTQRTGESKLDGAIRDQFRIFGIPNSSADNRVDVHGKFGEVREVFEFLVEDLEALERHVIRLNIVDTDLKMFKSCFI